MTNTIGNAHLFALLLVIALAVALVPQRLRVPDTPALVIVGLLFGVFAALPGVEMDPQTVVLIFVPALLFEGAWALDTSLLKADRLIVLLVVLPGTRIASAGYVKSRASGRDEPSGRCVSRRHPSRSDRAQPEPG